MDVPFSYSNLFAFDTIHNPVKAFQNFDKVVDYHIDRKGNLIVYSSLGQLKNFNFREKTIIKEGLFEEKDKITHMCNVPFSD